MPYRPLGKSNLLVSNISMGCMSLEPDFKSFENVINLAIDSGINFFDTADLYDKGINETLLGKSLGHKRQEVILATKVGNQWNEAGTAWNWNPSKKYISSAIEASLQRLKTDYIDLYQLHGGTLDDPIDETIEAFEILKEQGKIREYGISSIRPNVIREYLNRSNIVSIMMQYSLLDRRPEEACLDLIRNHDVSIITRGTLAKGLLCGKPAKPYLDHSAEAVAKASRVVERIAVNEKDTPSRIACRYVLQSDVIASAVIGFRTAEQVKSILDGGNLSKLDKNDYESLMRSVPAKTYQNHR